MCNRCRLGAKTAMDCFRRMKFNQITLFFPVGECRKSLFSKGLRFRLSQIKTFCLTFVYAIPRIRRSIRGLVQT
jgi:hypothetical protein